MSWLEILREPGYGPVSIMCGNPVNFSLTDGSLQLIFPFGLPTAVFLFLKKSQVILKKGGSTPVLENHTKGNVWLKGAFLGESQRVAG